MIESKIAAANDRLKMARTGIRIEQRGDRLILRGIFPPVPGSKKTEPHQQRLSIGLPCTPAGIVQAEKEARKISALIACKEFDWNDYKATPKTPRHTLQIEKFHRHYIAKGGKEETWKKEYGRFFESLGGLTPDDLSEVVLKTEPNTRNRIRVCHAVKALAKFCEIPLDVADLRGNYNPYTSTGVRDIPSDSLILEWYAKIPNPNWQFIYGLIAAYGLRNHEALRIDLSLLPVVQISENTKTGFREIWPCPGEWVEQFALAKSAPPPLALTRSNQSLGHAVTLQFDRYGIPFNPYDLRHAWAIRTLEVGWPLELSAQMMGHSVTVHSRTYQRWITRERKQKIYDRLNPKNNPKNT
jgi:integrase